MKIKRFVSVITAVVLLLGVWCTRGTVSANTGSTDVTTVIACSDFQHEQGNAEGKKMVADILAAMKKGGITSADGFLCCGDYDYEYVETKQGVDALTEAVSGVVSGEMVFVQGNHDSAIGTNGMSPSGNNDPAGGEYGVFVINEDDYMWYNDNEETVKRTAQNLIEYLNQKIRTGYDKPIFVLSHLPLHYSMRTKNDGDGQYAKYLFDVLNEAGKKGLNIFFMYGHDHSNGWDDYLGGAAVYLKKGDKILIAQNSRTAFQSETLNFTYMNAGFVGYYRNVNGADDTLTMTAFEISADSVSIVRYDKNGIHDLKSKGVRNSYKNESGYEPNTTVYASPQTVTLTKVTDTSLLENLIKDTTISGVGARYKRVQSTGELKSGAQYLLVCNTDQDYIMLPKSVTKTNSAGDARIGFDIEKATAFGANAIFGDYGEKGWTLTKTDGGWLVGAGGKYIRLSSTSNNGIAATLENTGTVFQISGSADQFTFGNGTYVLNYNARGLINGYASNPVPFYIYEFTGYTIDVTKGTASAEANASATAALPGTLVTVTADRAAANTVFDQWKVLSGDVVFADKSSATTTFVMPNGVVEIEAVYKTTGGTASVPETSQGGEASTPETSESSQEIPADGEGNRSVLWVLLPIILVLVLGACVCGCLFYIKRRKSTKS